jgi:transglutaminase-like putative cysteine protease
MADVPGADALDAAVRARQGVAVSPSADVLYLLDDEVTALRADGSTVNYVTTVAYAVNDAGRDRLTHQTLRSDGRARVLHAYAVDEAGKRTEASTIRGRSVRFRQLGVGTTVVLQYRLDSAPDGYLASHLARQWWFAGPAGQTLRSRWVLYAPPGTPLLESRRGEFAREQRPSATCPDDVDGHRGPARGARAGHAHAARGGGQPGRQHGPRLGHVRAVGDLAAQGRLPRRARGRSAGAKRLFEGAQTPAEKVARIQEWLMDEVRYQQDYEGFIAGVKPHAAPVVLARRYGDCKDKAVLFITLAHLGGVQAHFALVRTRDAGPVVRDVPMQQFNHAIVYVPTQPGIAEGRFFDPTVELLDIPVLRHDDQGTWSLVLDPTPIPGGHEDRARRSTLLVVARDPLSGGRAGPVHGEHAGSSSPRMGPRRARSAWSPRAAWRRRSAGPRATPNSSPRCSSSRSAGRWPVPAFRT